MNRRTFAQSMGGAAALSALADAQTAAPSRKTHIYRLDYYYLRQGSQGTRLNDFLSSQLPLFTKNTTAFGVFATLVGPHNPTTVVLSGFPSLTEMEAADDRIRNTPAYRTALARMEEGAEPAYDRLDRVILRPTPFASDIAPLKEKPAKPRVFELRVYHAPTERQLGFVHDRFSGPEIPIFHKSGIHPILYADTIAGPNMPNLTYLMPFANLDAREKAWDAFGADPAWIKARDESITRGGQIVAANSIILMRPAPFSPIQ